MSHWVINNCGYSYGGGCFGWGGLSQAPALGSSRAFLRTEIGGVQDKCCSVLLVVLNCACLFVCLFVHGRSEDKLTVTSPCLP